MRDALTRIGGIADPPLEPIVPAASPFFYRNKMEYSFTQTPDGPALGLHRAGRWDEVLEIEKCWLTTDLGNAIRNAVRDWAREEGLVAYDQAEHTGYLRHLVVREGRNTGQVLVLLVTAPGEKFERGYLVEVLTALPGGALDPLGRQRPAVRGDEPAVDGCSGARTRSRRSSSACASASGRTRSCRRTPRWPSSCTSSRSSTPR